MSKHYRGKVNMGNYDFSAKELRARTWCHQNNIWMMPFAKTSKEWFIDVKVNGQTRRSPVAYYKDDIWKKCFEFYMYYYKKLNK